MIVLRCLPVLFRVEVAWPGVRVTAARMPGNTDTHKET